LQNTGEKDTERGEGQRPGKRERERPYRETRRGQGAEAVIKQEGHHEGKV